MHVPGNCSLSQLPLSWDPRRREQNVGQRAESFLYTGTSVQRPWGERDPRTLIWVQRVLRVGPGSEVLRGKGKGQIRWVTAEFLSFWGCWGATQGFLTWQRLRSFHGYSNSWCFITFRGWVPSQGALQRNGSAKPLSARGCNLTLSCLRGDESVDEVKSFIFHG